MSEFPDYSKAPSPKELLAPGHSMCAGCGPGIVIRHLLNATGPNCVVCEATGCVEVTTSAWPNSAWRIPWIHVLFENACSVASGVREALNAKGKEDVKVIALAGDGGMADIGIRALSGMLERGHDILALCYDNEAYMNTGVQRSGSTPFGASTTTAPAGSASFGKQQWKKNTPMIALAHNIPYVATASLAYPEDFIAKVKKAHSIKGPKYIHVHAPCPTGWGYASEKTVWYAKQAVETGLWMLYEIENGKLKMSVKPKELKPAKDYLQGQRRFKHLKDEQISFIEKHVKKTWAELEKLEKSGINLLDIL